MKLTKRGKNLLLVVGMNAVLFGTLGVVGCVDNAPEVRRQQIVEVFELDGKTDQRVFLEVNDVLETPNGEIVAPQDMTVIVSQKGKYVLLDK